jgi:hypothetical protein
LFKVKETTKGKANEMNVVNKERENTKKKNLSKHHNAQN